MRAILLAAGRGKRLKPLTDSVPKSLINIGGKSILERMLDSLIEARIEDVHIVVGHLNYEIIRRFGERYGGARINYVLNPDYEMGSALSAWAARRYFDADVLLMDADVVFEPAVLRRLVESENENCFVMDKGYTETGEEMKVAALKGRVVQVARRITEDHDEVGEGVGFFKLSQRHAKELEAVLREVIGRDKESDYEDSLDRLVRRVPAGFEEVTGLRWTEIDFPDDVKKAEALRI